MGHGTEWSCCRRDRVLLFFVVIGVSTPAGTVVGGVDVCEADGLDVGIGADELILSFHQLSMSSSSESSVTWTVLVTSVVNGAADCRTLGLGIKVGVAFLI